MRARIFRLQGRVPSLQRSNAELLLQLGKSKCWASALRASSATAGALWGSLFFTMFDSSKTWGSVLVFFHSFKASKPAFTSTGIPKIGACTKKTPSSSIFFSSKILLPWSLCTNLPPTAMFGCASKAFSFGFAVSRSVTTPLLPSSCALGEELWAFPFKSSANCSTQAKEDYSLPPSPMSLCQRDGGPAWQPGAPKAVVFTGSGEVLVANLPAATFQQTNTSLSVDPSSCPNLLSQSGGQGHQHASWL